MPDIGHLVYTADGPWGYTHYTVIINRNCTPNMLIIFSCNFDLEEMGFEPRAARGMLPMFVF